MATFFSTFCSPAAIREYTVIMWQYCSIFDEDPHSSIRDSCDLILKVNLVTNVLVRVISNSSRQVIYDLKELPTSNKPQFSSLNRPSSFKSVTIPIIKDNDDLDTILVTSKPEQLTLSGKEAPTGTDIESITVYDPYPSSISSTGSILTQAMDTILQSQYPLFLVYFGQSFITNPKVNSDEKTGTLLHLIPAIASLTQASLSSLSAFCERCGVISLLASLYPISSLKRTSQFEEKEFQERFGVSVLFTAIFNLVYSLYITNKLQKRKKDDGSPTFIEQELTPLREVLTRFIADIKKDDILSTPHLRSAVFAAFLIQYMVMIEPTNQKRPVNTFKAMFFEQDKKNNLKLFEHFFHPSFFAFPTPLDNVLCLFRRMGKSIDEDIYAFKTVFSPIKAIQSKINKITSASDADERMILFSLMNNHIEICQDTSSGPPQSNQLSLDSSFEQSSDSAASENPIDDVPISDEDLEEHKNDESQRSSSSQSLFNRSLVDFTSSHSARLDDNPLVSFIHMAENLIESLHDPKESSSDKELNLGKTQCPNRLYGVEFPSRQCVFLSAILGLLITNITDLIAYYTKFEEKKLVHILNGSFTPSNSGGYSRTPRMNQPLLATFLETCTSLTQNQIILVPTTDTIIPPKYCDFQPCLFLNPVIREEKSFEKLPFHLLAYPFSMAIDQLLHALPYDVLPKLDSPTIKEGLLSRLIPEQKDQPMKLFGGVVLKGMVVENTFSDYSKFIHFARKAEMETKGGTKGVHSPMLNHPTVTPLSISTLRQLSMTSTDMKDLTDNERIQLVVNHTPHSQLLLSGCLRLFPSSILEAQNNLLDILDKGDLFHDPTSLGPPKSNFLELSSALSALTLTLPFYSKQDLLDINPKRGLGQALSTIINFSTTHFQEPIETLLKSAKHTITDSADDPSLKLFIPPMSVCHMEFDRLGFSLFIQMLADALTWVKEVSIVSPPNANDSSPKENDTIPFTDSLIDPIQNLSTFFKTSPFFTNPEFHLSQNTQHKLSKLMEILDTLSNTFNPTEHTDSKEAPEANDSKEDPEANDSDDNTKRSIGSEDPDSESSRHSVEDDDLFV
ncbi:hypothetical protein BLNAU_99 [Blattamonas nauphoetae]|uniref:Uncharacterized protein n=1 Tax=Blattamonas nauphoetae TaxID=2049346 RepID=A0ABQ9YM08_9EUKA|nr:hypothetical protein BLNAU_99 [Blattamonas nauphoetae]